MKKQLTIQEMYERKNELQEFLERIKKNIKEQNELSLSDGDIQLFITELLGNMDENGLYHLIKDSDMPKDARIDFIYEPTYLVISIFAKLVENELLDKNTIETCLKHIMQFQKTISKSGIPGHGYESISDIERALQIMEEGGLLEYFHKNANDYQELNECFGQLNSSLQEVINKRGILGPWGEDLTVSYESIFNYLTFFAKSEKSYIFVYGTLMRNGCLHGHLKDAAFISDALLTDHAMYNVTDWYPGIKKEKKKHVIGEVFKVDQAMIEVLDNVEGSAYDRKIEIVTLIPSMEKKLAYVYEYNGQIDGCSKIVDGVWKDKLFNYFAYGSCINKNSMKDGFTSRGEIPDYDVVGLASIKGYKLDFTYYSSKWDGGVLDIVESNDDEVIGLLYELPWYYIRNIMDKREGHPNCYNRCKAMVTDENGNLLSAIVYIVNKDQKVNTGVKPSLDYVAVVLEGMKEYNFSEKYLDKFRSLLRKYNIEGI